MSSVSEDAEEARPILARARRPTLLYVRDADGLDETETLIKHVGGLAHVTTLGWSGARDPTRLAALIDKHLADQELVVFAERALTRAALAVQAANVLRVVALDAPDDAVVAPRPVDVILRSPDAVSPSLARIPGVRVHRALPDGEEVGQVIGEVIREACRRAAANSAPAAKLLDAPLLEATPLSRGTVGYLGPEGDAFVAAFAARQPAARAVVLPLGADTSVDVLVLGGSVPVARLEDLLGRLNPEGWLVARWAPADALPADLADALARAGLRLAAPVDQGGTGVFRAQRDAPARQDPMLVVYSASAPTLMDIRTRLPAQQLASDPDLDIRYLVPMTRIPPAPIDQPKVAVLQRARADMDSWRQTAARFIARGWVAVFECDDHPQLIAEMAGEARAEDVLRSVGYLHAVQTSVEPLADVFRAYNPEVEVFPNAAFELLPFPQNSPPRQVFYGATPRGELPVAVARALKPAIERFPDTEFVIVGSRAVFDALPTARKSLHTYMGYESYLDLMASCAVSLTPIDALPLRETKSDAKFVDASRGGVLTIASPTVYGRTIRHGENGLIAAELADWPRMLAQAFADPDATRRMARQAWEEVRDGRMFAHQIAARKAWYRSLWDRRDELNEALMARLPGLREEVASILG